jgi:hypothetical protein
MNFRMSAGASLSAVTFALLATALVQPAMTPALAKNPPTPVSIPKILSDGIGAKSGRVEGLNLVRYIEIMLTFKDPKTGKLVANVYNSSLRSAGVVDSKDTAPQAQVVGLDFNKIAAEYGVLKASLNGPKLWMCDWFEVEIGKEREFNGIKAPWVAQLNIGNDKSVSDVKPYTTKTIARKSGVGWNKGTKVLLLDDDKGNTWVMKGFQLGVKPQHTYEEFVAAGAANFKKLPAGWKFRTKILNKDLIEKPTTGVATLTSDEFFNVYDKSSPDMMNYKP